MDYFALLNEPRRPWLDPEALKAKFFLLTATTHPDRVQESGKMEASPANHGFADLNAAYNTLRDPKLRLAHLIELESGAKPSELQQVPPDLSELWVQIGQLCREVDAFLRKKQSVQSPLLQVESFEQAQSWVERLVQVQQRLTGMHDRLLEDLKLHDGTWPSAIEPVSRAGVLVELESLYRLFGFTGRWAQQVQERIVLLSL